MQGPYSKCAAIFADGSEVFWLAVKKHLDRISAVQSGPVLLQAIQRTGKRITIRMAGTSGNSTSFANAGSPLLVQAILANDDTMFRNELKVAIKQAAAKGIPLEITTGLPPYQYEEFSDNRFRTELGPEVALRMKY